MLSSSKNIFIKRIMFIVQHYNPDKYWKRRSIVINPNNKTIIIIKLYFLYYIKRCDSYACASMGTDLNKGAYFKTVPHLPHHLNGIIISPNAKIGSNCTIFQQVTIGQSSNGKAPQIGDNVLIGAGAKIIGDIIIGNNVKIGANCIVVENIPNNTTVVLNKPRILNSK